MEHNLELMVCSLSGLTVARAFQENKKSSGKQEKFLFHTVTQKIYQRI